MEMKKDLQSYWDSLPQEMLTIIAKNLTEISDFVRFRAVCRAWRSSTLITELPPHFPWILEYHDYRSRKDLWFYSIPHNKIYTIHAPKASGKFLSTPSQGYFLSLLSHNSKQTSQLSLFNPLNSHEILLPVLDYGFGQDLLGNWHNQKGDYVVCCGIYHPNEHKLVFYCLGQDNWSEIKLEFSYQNFSHLYFNRMHYTTKKYTDGSTEEFTRVTDITTGNLACVVAPAENHLPPGVVHLIEASGHILRVHQHCLVYDVVPICKYTFDIHRLDVKGSGSPCWIKTKNIGNFALFLDSYGGFAHMANDSSGIKKNCIYLLKTMDEGIPQRPLYAVERIDIETDARTHFSCLLKNPERWFAPNLNRI